jgi:hypothetical protein
MGIHNGLPICFLLHLNWFCGRGGLIFFFLLRGVCVFLHGLFVFLFFTYLHTQAKYFNELAFVPKPLQRTLTSHHYFSKILSNYFVTKETVLEGFLVTKYGNLVKYFFFGTIHIDLRTSQILCTSSFFFRGFLFQNYFSFTQYYTNRASEGSKIFLPELRPIPF